ncbi:MAG: hypothetical protein RL582_884 [Bacteroidota bacterium]
MKALLIGATGATGKDLLELLLEDDSFEKVDIFVRRSLDIQHNKLKVHVVDFDQPNLWRNLVQGDVLFSCLGTTLKVAGSKEKQKKVDYLYQLQFAKAARENKVKNYILVSSDFASSKSPFFYSKIKGQLEDEVRTLGFPKLIIFNPPSLVRKNSDRKIEVIFIKIIRFFNAFGFFNSIKPLETALLAKAMIYATKSLDDGAYAFTGPEIIMLASK